MSKVITRHKHERKLRICMNYTLEPRPTEGGGVKADGNKKYTLAPSVRSAKEKETT